MSERARELANRVMDDWPSGTDAWAAAVELWALLDVVDPQCEIIRKQAAELTALRGVAEAARNRYRMVTQDFDEQMKAHDRFVAALDALDALKAEG